MSLLTTKETAEKLGVTVKRVQAMILAGRLPAERFGRALVINESDLALVADRKPGRPPKPKDEGEQADGATGAPVAEEATDTARADLTEAKPKRTRKAKAAKKAGTKKRKAER